MGADGSISTVVLLSAFVLYLNYRFSNTPTSAIPKHYISNSFGNQMGYYDQTQVEKDLKICQ